MVDRKLLKIYYELRKFTRSLGLTDREHPRYHTPHKSARAIRNLISRKGNKLHFRRNRFVKNANNII